VPVPKEVNPNCGLAISFLERERHLVMPILEAAGLAPAAFYRRQGDQFSDWAPEG
jgi:hypothetical protein